MVSDWFLLVFIGDIVVVVIYVFSFLGYKITCMYIGCISHLLFLFLEILNMIFLISKLFGESGVNNAVLILVVFIM